MSFCSWLSAKPRRGPEKTSMMSTIQSESTQTVQSIAPIQLYKEYKRRRPVSELSPESRLFLQPKKFSTKPETGTKVWYKSATVWYKSQPHGKNSLEKYMRELCDMAGLPKDISLSNISARKHLVTTCKAAGVPDSTTIKVNNASQMYT